MSLTTDIFYLKSISHQLDLFSEKSTHLFNCRCPICGDSSKRKNKARGYFYKFPKANRLAYKCHNCGASMSFANFLQQFDPQVYNEYIFDSLKTKPESIGKTGSAISSDQAQKVLKRLSDFSAIATPINDLKDNHPAKQMMKNRKIPKVYWSYMYWADNFKEFVSTFIPNTNVLTDSRIIIPYESRDWNILGFQGRSILHNAQIRYITIKIDELSPKIYGIPFIDDTKEHVYIMEGVFDAMMVPNSIAMLGSDISHSEVVSFFPRQKLIYVFDNEPRNKEIVNKIDKHISLEHTVVIWPENVPTGEDVNSLVIKGMKHTDVEQIILDNAHSGLKAKLFMKEWRKV